ncbi:MAG: endonuclease domain-containing protein [Chitinophagales bacterium]
MFYGADTITFEHARMLRNNMTAAEKKLWLRLQKNKMGVRIKPQHPIARFVVDFYCHRAMLVIEIDGTSHFSEQANNSDLLRTNELQQFGLRVIRFTNEQVAKDIDGVVIEIHRQILERMSGNNG